MKIFLSSIALLFSTALQASDEPGLWNTITLVDLKRDVAQLLINVPYPDALGDRSFCGVEILASNLQVAEHLADISKELLVRDGYDEERGLVTLEPIIKEDWPLSYRLASKDTFMTYVWIKAPEGKTLSEYFEDKLGEDTSAIMLHGVRCDDRRFKRSNRR